MMTQDDLEVDASPALSLPLEAQQDHHTACDAREGQEQARAHGRHLQQGLRKQRREAAEEADAQVVAQLRDVYTSTS